MKPNLIIHYENGVEKCSANFCLNEKQMKFFEECESVCSKWANLVLNRYATNTDSALHRRRINKLMNDMGNVNFCYDKVK